MLTVPISLGRNVMTAACPDVLVLLHFPLRISAPLTSKAAWKTLGWSFAVISSEASYVSAMMHNSREETKASSPAISSLSIPLQKIFTSIFYESQVLPEKLDAERFVVLCEDTHHFDTTLHFSIA